jgi:tripartite-type tricarboxylate transporter receptor subunit TctC
LGFPKIRICSIIKKLIANLAGVAPAVFAQTWPTKPIKLMADFPAGGGTDAMARLIADRLI